MNSLPQTASQRTQAALMGYDEFEATLLWRAKQAAPGAYREYRERCGFGAHDIRLGAPMPPMGGHDDDSAWRAM